ncbi:hypothetical protein Tco_0788905 [Tanacetum coccineum]
MKEIHAEFQKQILEQQKEYSITFLEQRILVACLSNWSRRARNFALSSSEAEYTAVTSAARQALWLRKLLVDFDCEQKGATKIFCDNSGTIKLEYQKGNVDNKKWVRRNGSDEIPAVGARQMSTSTMDHFTPSPNEKYYRSSVFPKIKHIFDRILRRCFPKLKENNAFFRPLDGEARKYGDYVCFNVFEICEELRKNNPDLFDERKPKDIAMEIIRELEFENTDMISKHSIQLHDIGVITFKLHGSWIAKRVEKMFNDGIDTCAPVIYESKAKAVFLSRTNIPVAAADMLRADFIIDALARSVFRD